MLAALFTGSAAYAQDCTVKLGVVGPMTGGGAAWGLARKAGTEFEAAWVNANGGLQVGDKKCSVSVLTYDAQSTAAGAAAASNYLASEGVHAIVGPVTSPEVAGFNPIAKRNSQVSFSSSYSQQTISPNFPLAFADGLDPTVWGPSFITLAKERFGFNSVVILGPNDQAGTDAAKPLTKLYTDAGVEATVEFYQRGTTNFAPIVTRLMASPPDLVELASLPPGDGGVFVKQMIEAGYSGAFDRSGAGAETIIRTVGGPELLKQFFWQDAVPTEDPGIVRFKAEFEDLMKTPPPENSLLYSAQISAEQLLRAISLAGGDQDAEKIAAELRKMTPESRYLGKAGWRGKTQFGINQQSTFPIGMGAIADGKMQEQVKIEIATE